ncbi:hypothetical protein DITRI_Ditri09bG0122700 [Diplodiscus trichospermus]
MSEINGFVNLQDSSESRIPGSSLEAKDWRKLFAASLDQALQFFPPKILDEKIVVSPPTKIFEEGEDLWRHAVVALFIGQVPNFSLFQRLVNIMWGSYGEVEIRAAGPNLFVIQLPNAATGDQILV